eukprot:360025-Chlamydomonas_euryale.AAC.5
MDACTGRHSHVRDRLAAQGEGRCIAWHVRGRGMSKGAGADTRREGHSSGVSMHECRSCNAGCNLACM